MGRRAAMSIVLVALFAASVVGPVESRAASRANAKATDPSRLPATPSPTKPALTGTPSQPVNPTSVVTVPRAAKPPTADRSSPARTTGSREAGSPPSRSARARARSKHEPASQSEQAAQGQPAPANAARGGLASQRRPARGRRSRRASNSPGTSPGATSGAGKPRQEQLAAAERKRRHQEPPGGGHGGKHRKIAPPPSSGKQGSGGKQASSSASTLATVNPVTAAVAAAAVAPSVSPALVPQIAGSTGQPNGGSTQLGFPIADRSTRAEQAARAHGPVAATAPTGGTALIATAQTPTRIVRTVSSRAHVPAHATSNPLEAIGRHIPLPIPVPDWSKPIIIALLLLAAWFGVRSRFAAMRARRLERQRVTLIRDLGAMQAALVPEVPPRLGGLAVSVAYRPAEGPAAGGDFYDVFTTESGNVAIMLGDVAGHGHEAVTHAALTRYTLRAYLQAGLDPRAALALAGQVLVDPTRERYATVALGLFDAQSSELTYALAGHPPPILLGFPAREPLTICSSPPVGWGLPTGRRQSIVTLPAGAEACFFSDGITSVISAKNSFSLVSA